MNKLWWRIKYLDRSESYNEFDSSMIPFKLLPGLEEINNRKGHKFNTDQLELEIVDADIKVLMPSCSIWIGKKAIYVPEASRLILFERNLIRNDASGKIIVVGLVDEQGAGKMVQYNPVTGKHRTKTLKARTEQEIPELQTQFEESEIIINE